MACLELVMGPGAGQVFELNDVTLIGRHACCDVILEDGSVSRTHALLVRDDRGFVLRDLAASNGLFNRGRRVTTSQRLTDGDVIQVGGVFVMFHAEEHPRSLVCPVGVLATYAA